MPKKRKRTVKSERSTPPTYTETGNRDPVFLREKILVADPQPEICELVEEYLDSEGFIVSKVFNASDLLALSSDNSFDLIIMETRFPGQEDFDTIKKLRSIAPSIPIIVLTGHGEILEKIIGLEMGADDYLPKPFHLRELLARTKSVLRRSKQVATISKIERAITFRPEHYQAGLQILSYFHTVVSKKYPNKRITVSIIQLDDSIKLMVETAEGDQEIVEQVLDEYADVVLGKNPAETLLSNPIDVMELNYKLDLASAELRLHKQLYEHTKEQYESRIVSLEDQVKLLNKTIHLGMSREHKLMSLIEGLTDSLVDRSSSQALAFLKEKLISGVTEMDEDTVKQAASTLSKEKHVFNQILGICKDIVSHGGGHLLSEWVVGIASALPH